MDNSFDGREMVRCRVCRYGKSLERFYRCSLALLDAAIGPEDHKVSVFSSYAFNELYLCLCMGVLDECEGVYLLASELLSHRFLHIALSGDICLQEKYDILVAAL